MHLQAGLILCNIGKLLLPGMLPPGLHIRSPLGLVWIEFGAQLLVSIDVNLFVAEFGFRQKAYSFWEAVNE